MKAMEEGAQSVGLYDVCGHSIQDKNIEYICIQKASGDFSQGPFVVRPAAHVSNRWKSGIRPVVGRI